MRQAFLQILLMLIKCFGAVAVFTGLALVAGHHCLWGLLVFIIGLTTLGLREEGWL